MKTTKRDTALFPQIFPFTSPEKIPVTFSIGGKKVVGFPAEFKPVYERRRIDSDIYFTLITAHTPCGLELRAECREYLDYDVVEWVAYIENKSDTDSAVISDFALGGHFAGNDPVLYHSNGDTCNEEGYEWWLDKITSEPTVLRPCGDGTSCNGAFPYMRMLFDGFGVNAAIGWTATWKADIRAEGDGIDFFTSQANLRTYLKPGETIRTPSLVLQIFAGGDDRGRNLWRSWYIDHVLPREDGHPLDPKLVVHTWMIDGLPEFCGVTEENQLKAINTYLEKGFKPDIWWIDAGWYPCNNDWSRTGTWIPNPEHFPNGMAPVGKLCAENNIDFLVWFEPERVRKGTELWNQHPDFLLYYKRDHNDWYSDNALLNLAKPEVCDWLIETVDKLIKDNGVKIYRQDFNFAPELYWEDNKEKDRDGILENLHIQGYYRYWDALIERNPGLWMDSCSSGGRRNDIETMKRGVPLHYTDVGYGVHPIKQKQHRTMFEWIPYFRAHTYNWDKPDGTYGGNLPVDEFAYHNATAPAITSMIEWNDPPELFAIGNRFHPVWREAAKLELSCDFYPLTECRKDSADWYAIQFDGQKTGFIQIIRNINVKSDSVTVYPHIDENKTYTFTDPLGKRSFKVNGKMLAQAGFNDTLPERSGVIWFYNKK